VNQRWEYFISRSLSARFFIIHLKRAPIVSPSTKEVIRVDEIRRGEWGNFNQDDIKEEEKNVH